jgi:hypothetical protein
VKLLIHNPTQERELKHMYYNTDGSIIESGSDIKTLRSAKVERQDDGSYIATLVVELHPTKDYTAFPSLHITEGVNQLILHSTPVDTPPPPSSEGTANSETGTEAPAPSTPEADVTQATGEGEGAAPVTTDTPDTSSVSDGTSPVSEQPEPVLPSSSTESLPPPPDEGQSQQQEVGV